MYGYVLPDKPNMFMKDFTLYRAYYCGMCKRIGKNFSLLTRLTTNYDITFLNLLLHGVKGQECKFENKRCILSPFKRKTVAAQDALSDRIIDVNNILMKYKFLDDKNDENSLKAKLALLVFRRSCKKSAKREAEAEEIIKTNCDALAKIEGGEFPGIDQTAHPFGVEMRELVKILAQESYSEALGELAYQIGRWVYLVDALDDIDEDFREKRFNPFLKAYPYINKAEFLKTFEDDLKILIMGTYNRIKEEFAKIALPALEGVITNIIWFGLKKESEDALKRSEKCKRIRL